MRMAPSPGPVEPVVERPIVVEFTMTAGDWLRASLSLASARVLVLVGVAVAGTAAVHLADLPGSGRPWMVFPAAIVAVVLAGLAWRAGRTIRRRPDLFPDGPQRVEIGPEGIVYAAPGTETRLGWPFVRSVRRRGRWLVVWMGTGRGLVIPRRTFGDRRQEQAFLDAAAAWRRAPAPALAAPTPSTDGALATCTYSLDLEDFTALRRLIVRERARQQWGSLLIGALVMLLALATAVLSLRTGSDLGEIAFLLLLAWVGGAATAIPFLRLASARWATRRAMRREPHRFPTGPRELAVWPDRFEVTTAWSQSRVPWSMVRRIEEDGPRLYLFVDATHAFIVRRDAIGDAIPDLTDRIHLWRAGGPAAPGAARGDPSRALADPFAPPEE